MKAFKKLKIAIGVHGNIVFLEKFPDDEDHPYMNESLPDIESDSTFNDFPGIYLATLEFVGGRYGDHNGEEDAQLEIVNVEAIWGAK